MYAFIFAVVQCGKGDAETILIVVQADVRSVGEVLVLLSLSCGRANRLCIFKSSKSSGISRLVLTSIGLKKVSPCVPPKTSVPSGRRHEERS